MSTPTTFLSLPGELRNHVYQYSIFRSLEAGCDTVKVWKILRRRNELRDKTEFNMALAFAQTCPFLFTRKSIMLEALSLCLGACTFDFGRLEILDVMVWWSSHSFLELTHHVRSVFFDASPCLPSHRRIPNLTSFEKSLSAMQKAFPKAEKLCLLLDENSVKPSIAAIIKEGFANLRWPTLQKITIRRKDLEARARGERRPQRFNELFELNTMDEVRSVLHTLPAYGSGSLHSNVLYNAFMPPQRMHMRRWALSWSLEMDFLWLERFNEDVAEILRKASGLEEEDPDEAGKLVIGSMTLKDF